MEVSVTKVDIESGENPVEFACERAFGKHCTVDKKFLIVGDNRHPFRLPLSAEISMINWNKGLKIEPFKFNIGS